MFKGKILAACATALLVSAASQADDSGFYLGAAAGVATKSNSVFDDGDTSFKWLGGYSFNKHFAAEAGFMDAGKQKDTIGALDVRSASDGTFVAVLAKFPIGKIVAPYVTLGYAFYDTTETIRGGGARSIESTSGDDPLYGGGLEFSLGEHIRLRVEYEKVDVPDLDFDNYSVVFTYRF